MKSTSFRDSLLAGRISESKIASYLRRCGWCIIPVYELEVEGGKGPQIFAPNGESVIAPDLIAYRNGSTRFVEAKTKTVFSWRRKPPGPRWETGIDLRHFHHYCRVTELFPAWDLHLLFLHTCSTPWHKDRLFANCPEKCPTGLFRGRLSELQTLGRIDDRHANGMVYWGEKDLEYITTLKSVLGP